MALSATTLDGLFSALFGDGSILKYEGGRWTFDPIPNFPKQTNEGILSYVFRLLQSGNVLYNRGAWSSSATYPVGSLVAHNGLFWVAKQSNTNSAPATGNQNWDQLLSTLTGLKGDPGRDGVSAVTIAP